MPNIILNIMCVYEGNNGLCTRLWAGDVGCHIGNIFACEVVYADDIKLVAYNKGLHVVNICYHNANEIYVTLNGAKSIASNDQ